MGFWSDAWDATKRGVKTVLDPMDLTGIGPQPYGGLDENGEAATSKVPDPDKANFELPGAKDRADRLLALADQYGGRTAPQAQGAQANDSSFRGDQESLINRLRMQMDGGDSLAQMQLRRATDGNIAQQRSLAASANPQNAAMMARLASQNIGRMNQGAGQRAAELGIQERNAAANALGAVAGQGRAQDLGLNQFNAGQRQQNSQFNVGANLQQTGLNDQAASNARQQELANAQLQQTGSMGYEQNNTSRYGIDKGVAPEPSKLDQIGSMVAAAAPFMASDERAKTSAGAPPDGDLDSLIGRLKTEAFAYKEPERHGAGPRLGVMAQDVERGGRLGRELVSEQQGTKVIDVPKAVGTSLGLIGRLGERLAALEAASAPRARKVA